MSNWEWWGTVSRPTAFGTPVLPGFEMGYDLRTIADMLGQETEGMAGHYAKEADLKGKLDGVIDRLDKELG